MKIFFHHKYGRPVRFFLVGIWNTLFGFGLFTLLYLFLKPHFEVRYFAYTSAQIVSLSLAYLNAFICHKYITFRSPVRGKGILFEFVRFCMTNAATALFDLIGMPLLVEVFHWRPIAAAALIMPSHGIISYFAHSYFSFRKQTSSVHAA